MTTKEELEKFLADDDVIEPGKVVFLKSGGQPMTVRSIKNNRVICEWFERNGRLQTNQFLCHSLTGKQPAPNGRARGIVVIGNLDSEPTKNEH
jgi:uncharacterized protein YodC (DUF2158 family)